jgi:hypothetical protein
MAGEFVNPILQHLVNPGRKLIGQIVRLLPPETHDPY